MLAIAPDVWKCLYDEARAVSKFAFCPFSRFPVGAAVLAPDGRIFAGCNVENASYGLTICAERNAVFQAVATGVRQIVAVAIYTPTIVAAPPCGVCRQVLAQFGPQAFVHSICDGDNSIQRVVAELLPEAFSFPLDINSESYLDIFRLPR